jgi:ankyrin repeat protein
MPTALQLSLLMLLKTTAFVRPFKNFHTSRSTGDFTPLSFAARLGHTAVVAALLSRGPNVEAQTAAGDTPLLLAARWGFADVIDLLLKVLSKAMYSE